MKTTRVLWKQHLGKMFARHWKVQGKRIVRDTGANKILKELGFTVHEANEIIAKKPVKEIFPIIGFAPKQITFDSSHPDYHEKPCYVYKDHNVLLEGLDQAKVLTNTVEIEPGILPQSLASKLDSEVIPEHNQLVQRIIKSSLLFDAEQVKLPRRTDPERPAWSFPRDYGISDRRRNMLLCNRLVDLCASLSPHLNPSRRILNDAPFMVTLSRDNKDVLFSLRADLLVTSHKSFTPIVSPDSTSGVSLPVLSPLLPTVSLEESNIYRLENVFPLLGMGNVHTALVHYNETEVSNLYETEVTESQFLSRTLLKSFTFALAQARNKYGMSTEDFMKPVVVQCIQTDGKVFHFSVFQLNTSREDGEPRNVFWSYPRLQLYETCEYIQGRPVFEGYNPDVFKLIRAFYNNS